MGCSKCGRDRYVVTASDGSVVYRGPSRTAALAKQRTTPGSTLSEV